MSAPEATNVVIPPALPTPVSPPAPDVHSRLDALEHLLRAGFTEVLQAVAKLPAAAAKVVPAVERLATAAAEIPGVSSVAGAVEKAAGVVERVITCIWCRRSTPDVANCVNCGKKPTL